MKKLSVDNPFFDLDTGMGTPLRNDGPIGLLFAPVFGERSVFDESMELYIERFVYEDDKDMLRESFSLDKLKKELEVGKQHYVNYRIVRDGEVMYFQVKAVRAGAWDSSHGIVLGFRSVDEEIRSELEKKDLLENALMQANRANKAKSVFLSNMSHDIRTPT